MADARDKSGRFKAFIGAVLEPVTFEPVEPAIPAGKTSYEQQMERIANASSLREMTNSELLLLLEIRLKHRGIGALDLERSIINHLRGRFQSSYERGSPRHG